MISTLAEDHIPGSGQLKLTSSFGAPPYLVTVVRKSKVRGHSIADPKALTVFPVVSVSGNTLTVSTPVHNSDQHFSVGDYVALGKQLTDIDQSTVPGQVVYTSDRFDNPDFIKTLAYSKLTNVSLGIDTNQVGSNSLAVNEQTISIGLDSFASGYQSVASDNYTHTEGYQTIAGVQIFNCIISSHNVSINGDATDWFYNTGPVSIFNNSSSILTTVTSDPSYDGSVTTFTIDEIPSFSNCRICPTDYEYEGDHAEGYQTKAIGGASHAEGKQTIASQEASHAEGKQTIASEYCAHAEGLSTTASGDLSHSEGYLTTASGSSGHAEGQSTTASGSSSHAEGLFTTASGSSGHAEGQSTVASGNQSHAEGLLTIASGKASYSGGQQTTASGDYSCAGGMTSVSLLSTQWSRSSGYFSYYGDAQYSSICVYSDGSIDLLIGSTGSITVPDGHVYAFIATISAYDGTNAAMYIRQGIIRNVGGTYSLVGSIQAIGTDITHSGWSIVITANNGLKITPTGTAKWVARIDWVEIG